MHLKIFAILLVISLGAIGIAGFWWLGLMEDGAHMCPFASVLGIPCPSSLIALAAHHLSGLQEFLLGAINSGFSLLIVSIAAFFVLGRAFLSPPPRHIKISAYFNRPINEIAIYSLRRKFLRWLTLRYRY